MSHTAFPAASFKFVALGVVCLGLAACAGGPPKKVQGACGCASYVAPSPRPAWADREISTAEVYQSQGMAECTGIKSMDYADADRTARDSLGRMVNVQVKSEVISVIKDSGGAGGVSGFGKVSSEQVSNVLLKSSEIFAHWVDPVSCTVYAGVRVRKADIDRAIKEAEAAEKRKMVNQRWSLKSEGQYADVIAAQLGQSLSELGVTLQKSDGGGGLIMAGNVSDVSVQNDNRMARVSLKLEARNGASVVWNRLIPGKGVSFNREADAVLVKKAVQDALESAKDELKKLMQESVK